MSKSTYCSCDAETVKKAGIFMKEGKAICNNCGGVDASEYAPTMSESDKSAYNKDVRLSNLLSGAWIFVLCQGLVGGIVAGNLFPSTSNCNIYGCDTTFNWGSMFGGIVATVTFFGPFIFILRGIIEVARD